MITLVGTQLLHLKLDEISNGKVLDASGKGNDGTIQGAPQVVPDDALGGCLSFDGSTEYINLPPACMPIGNEMMVSFWAYGGDALPKSSAIIEAVDATNRTTLSIRVPWSDGAVYFSCGSDGNGVDSITQAAQPADFKGAWTYWAFTKNATTGAMNIYRNGVLWLNGTGMIKPLTTSSVVKLCATVDGNNRYPGKIAHVRIYNQVPSIATITHDMEADQTALSSFRKSYPIDFNLYNDDEQAVLDIIDDPAGQNLHLDVNNASGQVINLIAPSNPTASASNYHFSLRFRPDVLSITTQTYTAYAAFALHAAHAQVSLAQSFQLFAAPTASVAPATTSGQQPAPVPSAVQAFVASLPQSTPQVSAVQAYAVDTASALQGALQQAGWNLGYQQEPDGTIAMYFLSTQAQALPPDGQISVTLPHVSANGAGGARGTRVELLYQQLTFGNDPSPVSGRRQVSLSIVNQRGQKAIPLHVNFLGFNTILNDGLTQNILLLRITNVLQDNIIALNPQGSTAPSKFILSFDVQADHETKDWALGTTSQVSSIQVTPADTGNWTQTVSLVGASPEWILIPKSSKTALQAEEIVELTLGNIISSLPSGQTNLYIRYENIPGYWDGQFVVTIEKTPLLYRLNNVGINTSAPDRPLTIHGSGPAEELISFQDSNGTTRWHFNQHVNGSGLNIAESGVADGRMFIQAGGNIGINTLTPSAATQLTISASSQHLQLRREAGVAGDKVLFLELYQDEANPPPSPTPSPATPEIHPSIRFHHHNHFWHRIEGRFDGLHIKTGDMTSDSYSGITAGNGRFTGNLGIGTTTPHAPLEVKGSDYQFAITNAQEHNWGLTNWTDDKLYFQYREAGAFQGNIMSLDKHSTLTIGTASFQQGINWTAVGMTQYQNPSSGSHDIQALVTPNGLRIVGGDGGVLAVSSGDVMAWASYGIVVKGNVWATNKYFAIDHPTKPDQRLIHACLEGPESSVYYRGHARLEDGRATIRLPDYFEALTRQEGRTVLLTPEGREPFLLSYEGVVDGVFRVYGTCSDGAFSWEVKAVRADVEPLQTEVGKDEGMFRNE